MRIALGVSYAGQCYRGWQGQSDGSAVQNHLEAALEKFCGRSGRVATLCAGRTDAGVHALMQVVHFDTDLVRAPFSWVRGTNAWLPPDIAVQWAQPVSSRFHARACAQARRYAYVLLQSAVRPSLEAARVGWVHQALDAQAMREAASHLIGEHDFSAFRAAGCQAISPLKTLHHIHIHQRLEPGPHGMPVGYWRFDFCGNAFLHHMVRNIMGCLVAVGQGRRPPQWLRAVRESRQRSSAAPTFSAAGLYFLGPLYDPAWGLPQRVEALDALPFASG